MLAISGVPTNIHNRRSSKSTPNHVKRGNSAKAPVVLPPISQKHKSKPTSSSKKANKPAPQIISIPSPACSSSSQIESKSKSLLEEAEYLLSLPAKGDGSCGKVKVRYNHYQKHFPLYNGVVKWSDVDTEYAFSFVFKGKYGRELVYVQENTSNPKLYTIIYSSTVPLTPDEEPAPKKALHDENGLYFLGVSCEDDLLVTIQEDPEAGVGVEGLTLRSQPLLAKEREKEACCKKPGTNAVVLLTEELKALPADQLGGEAAKELIERRDIEDILFSPS